MIIYPNATGTASGQGHWNLYKLVSITEELNGGNYVPIKQVWNICQCWQKDLYLFANIK